MTIDFNKAEERFTRSHAQMREALKALEQSSKIKIVQVAREFDVADDLQATLACRLLDVDKAFYEIFRQMKTVETAVRSAFDTRGDSISR